MSNTEPVNKITYGLKNVYYAPITSESETAVVYDTPVKMPGAASISLPKNVVRTAIAADDDPEYAVLDDNKGYDGDLVLHEVPESFLTDCLGMKKDGETIVENKDDKPSPFALLFEFAGDKKKRRHLLYRCMSQKADITSQTKGDGVTVNQASLKITATPAKNTGDIKRSCNESDSTVYTNWFEQVTVSGTAS